MFCPARHLCPFSRSWRRAGDCEQMVAPDAVQAPVPFGACIFCWADRGQRNHRGVSDGPCGPDRGTWVSCARCLAEASAVPGDWGEPGRVLRLCCSASLWAPLFTPRPAWTWGRAAGTLKSPYTSTLCWGVTEVRAPWALYPTPSALGSSDGGAVRTVPPARGGGGVSIAALVAVTWTFVSRASGGHQSHLTPHCQRTRLVLIPSTRVAAGTLVCSCRHSSRTFPMFQAWFVKCGCFSTVGLVWSTLDASPGSWTGGTCGDS